MTAHMWWRLTTDELAAFGIGGLGASELDLRPDPGAGARSLVARQLLSFADEEPRTLAELVPIIEVLQRPEWIVSASQVSGDGELASSRFFGSGGARVLEQPAEAVGVHEVTMTDLDLAEAVATVLGIEALPDVASVGSPRPVDGFSEDDVASSCVVEAVRTADDGSVDAVAIVTWLVASDGAYLVGEGEPVEAAPAARSDIQAALVAVLDLALSEVGGS